MSDITELLKAANDGNEEALAKLLRRVEPELRNIARAYMRNEQLGHLLQPTALVNEAVIKFLREKIRYENRKHFFGILAKRMRQILVDYARKQNRSLKPHSIESESESESSFRCNELLLLDAALSKLAHLDERKAKVVEWLYFSGLSRREVARLLEMSTATVDREWSFARSWLRQEMS